ncbi:MAG: ABC transporter ATP-binding protein [Pseudomonadota bacterium]
MADGKPVSSELASIRRLWQLAGARRVDLAVAVLFRCLQAVALGLAFYTAILLVTHVTDGGTVTRGFAWQITGLATLSLAAQLAFSYLNVSRAWDASYQVGRALRLRLLEHLQTLPMGFHLSRHEGDTTTVLTTDIAMIESFLSDALAKIVQAVVLPLVLIAFIASKAPALTAALLAPIIVGLPLIVWAVRRFAPKGVERQDLQARAGAVMIEYVQGIRVVRAFNQIAAGQETFRAALERFRSLSIELVMLLAFPMVAFVALVMLGVPAVAATAAALLDGLPSSALITALVLVFAVFVPVAGLGPILERIRITDASLERFERILAARPLPQAPEERPGQPLQIAFRGVHFAYETGRPVLHDISFACEPRSMTAIVGPSGSGKSTILSLLSRFWDVDGGAITIGGADIRAIPPETLARLISVVFQDVHLFSGTIRENIAAGALNVSDERVRASAEAARAHDFISALPEGYDTHIGERGGRLSGGERQRIAIARAILKDAPIVLLDEATAALDPTNERAIQAALAALVADKTLLVVAHKLSTIEAADQILVLDQGRITENGTHADLIAQCGLYARMHSRKARAASWRVTSLERTGP